MGEASIPASTASRTMESSGFQSASSVLRASSSGKVVPNPGTMRNASGGLPPVPKTATPAPPPPAPNVSGAPVAPTGEKTEGESNQVPKVNKPINRPATSKKAIVYNAVQRRNPVLQSIKNVGIEIGDIVADYQVGAHNGVLFLSLKYHRLHPEYIHQRIEKMKHAYNVRILLVLCDVNEHQQSLRELAKIAIINNFTTFVAWSNEEVAQYLVTFKEYEGKSDASLKEPVHQSYHDQLHHVLTSGKKVNKTDADNLAAQYGSFANITKQSSKLLSNVKGLGATKVTSLLDAFNKPFIVGGLKKDGDASTDPRPSSVRIDAQGAEDQVPSEAAGSPDWPDDLVEDDVRPPSIGRERVPSRSPSPGLGAEEVEPVLEAWEDPLDDSDDEEEPATKRARVGE